MESNTYKTIHLLLNNPNISIREMIATENLTERQARYRITKVNELLKAENKKTITILKGNKIILSDESRDILEAMLSEALTTERFLFDKEERIVYMYLLLFLNLEYVSLNDFMDNLSSSKSTCLMDLKALEQELTRNGLTLDYNRTRGYFISGSEMDIRRAMMRLIIYNRFTNVYNTIIDDYHLDLYAYSKLVIQELAEKNNIQFVEDRLHEFIYIFTFLKARIQNGCSAAKEIEKLPNIDILSTTKEYHFTHDLLLNYRNLENFKSADIKYISSWILGISYGDINDHTQDRTYIFDLVDKIMGRFELLSGAHYTNTIDIFKQLYCHFRPAYYRLLFKLPIFNPLTDNVKNEYHELYEIVSETMRPFSSLFGEDIPDDEIAYLTMHFATIYSNRKTSEIPQRNALVVCSNGVGSSAILYNELKRMFPYMNFLAPIEVSQLKNIDTPVDIIFATRFADISRNDIPIIRVNPVMTAEEQYQVLHSVRMQLNINEPNLPSVDNILNIIQKYADIKNIEALKNDLHAYIIHMDDHAGMINFTEGEKHLKDIIQPEYILLHQNFIDWKQAIEISYSPLLKNECITEDYIYHTIKELENSPGYIVIAPHIALAHSKPENGAKKLAMGISILETPIKFGNENNDPVKYIFSLSALDNHTHLHCMNELLSLLNNKHFFNLLESATNSAEIIDFIAANKEIL